MTISRPPQTKKEASNKTADDFIKGKPAAQATQISLKLPMQLLNAIDARAGELSISRAAFIKQACSIYLEQD